MRTKNFFYCIFTVVLLKTGGLYLNLSVYQICCSAPPEKQEENVNQIHWLKNYTVDQSAKKFNTN